MYSSLGSTGGGKQDLNLSCQASGVSYQISGLTSGKANRKEQKVSCKEGEEHQGLMKTGYGADSITRNYV